MITVPPAFVAMPRWWDDEPGRAWLARLPSVVQQQCRRWGLHVDGDPVHGSNALVVPVRRAGRPFALRLAAPGDGVAAEVLALRTWAGRGTVELVDADEQAGATLLERLDHSHSLQALPLQEAVEVLAALTRVLAVPVGPEVRSTAAVARQDGEGFEAAWIGLDRPVPASTMSSVLAAVDRLASAPASLLAVDGDLHFEQVLAGRRSPWLVVDPVLLRGDQEYDLGRVLWSRLDEIDGDVAVLGLFDRFVDVAAVPRDRARDWVVVRSTSYLHWGLERGLTIDPPRCARLLRIFA